MRKAAISFGLVYIPVKYENAIQDQSISFNQLHKETKERIRYKKATDTIDNVQAGDIVKGYEYEKDKYIIMDNEDFEKIKTEKDKNIHIISFTDMAEIDPIYFEKSYYLVPDGSEKAFALLSKAILAHNKVAIAKTVLGTKETLVSLRAYQGAMLMETMYYLNEIKPLPQSIVDVAVAESEFQMASTLIESMSQSFNPADYRDEYQDRLRQAITEKISGHEVTQADSESEENVSSLMEALQASIQSLNGIQFSNTTGTEPEKPKRGRPKKETVKN